MTDIDGRGLELVVKVLGNDAPVVGARVVVGKHKQAVTNAEGVAKIGGILPDYMDARVLAEGFAPGHVHAFFREDPGGVVERTVRLEPGARVEGVVVGPDDKPVPHAEVELWNSEWCWLETAKADDAGRWHLDAVAIGKYRLTAEAKALSRGATLMMECDGKTPTRGVVVRVDIGGQVRGVVTTEAGELIAGATIVAILRGITNYEALSDQDGRFELMGLRVGEYDIAAKKAGQASTLARIDPPLLVRTDPVSEVEL